ncbi:MAG: hypothetical protein ACFFEF_03350 [Candidatus Thorarchaeota archaeon]
MKPIGTITMCFPHVDDETRSILQSVMEESEDFGDFTEKLCDRVCAQPSPPLLEYFAVYFSFRTGYFILVDKLECAGRVPELASPLLLLIRSMRDESVKWDALKESLKRGLISSPNDWITCHLYLTWRMEAERYFSEFDVDIKPIEAVTNSIENNKDLAFFKAGLLAIEAMKHHREWNFEQAVDRSRQALTIAREFDDQILVAGLLCDIANMVKETDTEQALDLLGSSRELGEKLGYRDMIGIVQHQLGHIMQARGELSAAIDYQLDARAIGEKIGFPPQFYNIVIAHLYNQMGKGEEALQMAKNSFYSSNRHRASSHVQLAWAFVNLGKYDEAEAELAAASNAAARCGDSGTMKILHLVGGILEKAKGNLDGAFNVLRDEFENLENDLKLVAGSICLLNLTEIEIKMLTDKSMKKGTDLSGPWMAKLIEHAEKNDFPGIAARALLLKAELRRKQGRFDDMHMLLRQVQETAKAPSMKYLNDLAVSMFPDIIVS